MKPEATSTCQACGKQIPAGLGFCPVCALRDALDEGHETVELDVDPNPSPLASQAKSKWVRRTWIPITSLVTSLWSRPPEPVQCSGNNQGTSETLMSNTSSVNGTPTVTKSPKRY